jgi:hypothetical protein
VVQDTLQTSVLLNFALQLLPVHIRRHERSTRQHYRDRIFILRLTSKLALDVAIRAITCAIVLQLIMLMDVSFRTGPKITTGAFDVVARATMLPLVTPNGTGMEMRFLRAMTTMTTLSTMTILSTMTLSDDI